MININFNENENKFISLAYGCRNDVAVSDKSDTNGVCLFRFKKHVFADGVLSLMLVYEKQSMSIQEFFKMLQYLHATNSMYILAGDFYSIKPNIIGQQRRINGFLDFLIMILIF